MSCKSSIGAVVLIALAVTSAKGQEEYFVSPDRTESIHQYGIGGGLWIADGDLLQTILIYTFDPDQDYFQLRRSFLEFTIPELAGDVTAELVLYKFYDSRGGRPFLVSVYDPEDEITLDTFYIDVVPFALFATDGALEPEVVTVDLSPVVSAYRGMQLGLRLTLADESPEGGWPVDGWFGAGFDDGLFGHPPFIHIVETVPDPAMMLEDLIAETGEISAPRGTVASLQAKLNGALQSWNSNRVDKVKAATNKMGAFIHEVKAQRDKKIAIEKADKLEAKANDIILEMKQAVP